MELINQTIANRDLEKEIISRLITESTLFKETYGRITKLDFFDERAKKIFEKLTELYEQRKEWNLIAVKSLFPQGNELHDFFFRIPQSIGLSQFILLLEILKKRSTQNQINFFLKKLNHDFLDIEPGTIVTDSLQFFSSIETGFQKQFDLATIIERHQKLMEDRINMKVVGIQTGFQQLDYMLGNGFQRKDLIIVGARPSVGKTSFALSVAYNAAKQNHKVLFVTLEMDEYELFDRLLSFETSIPVTTLIRGSILKDDLKDGYEKIRQLPLTIIHLPKATSGDIHSVASKYKYSQGLDLLIVDYLGYLSDRSDDEVNQLGRITKGLKTTANLLDLAVLAPHQLNRKIEQRAEKKREVPLLSDLRDSGHIEQDADIVIFLNREILGEHPEQTTLRIGKHRTGSTGIIDLKFNVLTTRFQ